MDDNLYMNEEIERLEIKIGFLEGQVEELNEVVITQDRSIAELQKKLELLEKKVTDLEEVSGEARPNRKPPHY